MNKSDNKAIVTVRVLTYNSSKYVLETLDSIKAQTYPYLALVISDDCSTDKTVKLCKEWVKENKQRFVSTKVLESPVNTGVSANGNRAEAACETKWVKGIAGDDILLPNCIQDNMDYVAAHPDTVYLFSRMRFFGASKKYSKLIESYYDYNFFSLDKEEQYERLVFKGNCIPAPTCFFNINTARECDIYNDERIPMIEDSPKWINVLKKGLSFHFMDRETINYRVHEKSLSTRKIANPKFYSSSRLFYYYYLRDEYIIRYGRDKVIEDDVKSQMRIYNVFLFYRNLFTSRILRFFYSIKKKMF